MTFRCRPLLNLAHDMPCLAQFPHDCKSYLGCHPMHANWQEWGRGAWHKAPDWAWASGCLTAHREIDGKINPTMDLEQRKAEWLRAYVATQDYLWTNGLIRLAPKSRRTA